MNGILSPRMLVSDGGAGGSPFCFCQYQANEVRM